MNELLKYMLNFRPCGRFKTETDINTSSYERLHGTATQIETLLRLLPLILLQKGKISNVQNPSWKLILNLREITMILYGPKINGKTELPALQVRSCESKFRRET